MSDNYHVVCPACAAVNRLPNDSDTASAKCGKCHKILFNGTPVALDDARFNKFIERNDLPVVVDFWAKWCGPCKMMSPVFAETAQEMEPALRFAKVDTEQAQRVATRYNIRSIPTIILFSKGREIARQAGAMGRDQLKAWIRQNSG
ncbi:MAG: thiol reductase thioredoxin [marine bacterium B5-7]|nr:MAG: thiol reductase thioredoxin [marine bacterium B5-7]